MRMSCPGVHVGWSLRLKYKVICYREADELHEDKSVAHQ